MKIVKLPPTTDKDRKVLHFIWWWKIATTSAVMGRFSQEETRHPTTVHWRLSQLKRKGLVDTAHVNNGSVWMVTSLGLKVIEHELPSLREMGSMSENIPHDLLVQAAQLGEWLPRGVATDIKFFTEQELRRIDPDCYPEWVPKTTLHRPDGYWHLPSGNGQRVVALEVEINAKSHENYQKVGNFYNQERRISAALWVIGAGAIINKVRLASEMSPFQFRDIHSFVDLSVFKELGWDAPIVAGGFRGLTMSAFLNQHRASIPSANTSKSPSRCWIQEILNTRLRPMNSMAFACSPKALPT